MYIVYNIYEGKIVASVGRLKWVVDDLRVTSLLQVQRVMSGPKIQIYNCSCTGLRLRVIRVFHYTVQFYRIFNFTFVV